MLNVLAVVVRKAKQGRCDRGRFREFFGFEPIGLMIKRPRAILRIGPWESLLRWHPTSEPNERDEAVRSREASKMPVKIQK